MADYVLEGEKWGSGTFGTTGGTVTWAIDSTVPAYFVSVLTAAFADWSRYGNIAFRQVGSTAVAALDFTLAFIDGPSNTLGRANYTFSGQVLSSATVTFDSGEAWQQSGSRVVSRDGTDLFLVALHEIGHAIGLDHYEGTPAVMNAVLTPAVTDLVASDIHGVQAIYGVAVAEPVQPVVPPALPTGPALAVNHPSDFTGDHRSDILFDNRANGNVVEWQMNGLTIQSVQVLNGGPIPTTFGIVDALADFNGDGKSDLLFRDPSSGTVAFWQMNGTGVAGISGVNAGKSFDVVDAHGDYNRDGRSDVLLRDFTNGNVSEFQMNGLSIASVLALPNVPTDFAMVSGHSNFNGDGVSDVLFRQVAGGQFKVWLMNGTASPVSSVFANLDASWSVNDASGDYNGDGTSDVLVRNAATGQFVTWQMAGGAIASAHDYGAIPTYLQVIDGHGDYNGDGNSDILWRNGNTGQIVIWTMLGGQLFSVNTIDGVPTTNVIVDGHDDYNGDGKSDLLFRDTGNGNVTEVDLYGPNVLGAAVLAQVPNVLAIANGSGPSMTANVAAGAALAGTVGDDVFTSSPEPLTPRWRGGPGQTRSPSRRSGTARSPISNPAWTGSWSITRFTTPSRPGCLPRRNTVGMPCLPEAPASNTSALPTNCST